MATINEGRPREIVFYGEYGGKEKNRVIRDEISGISMEFRQRVIDEIIDAANGKSKITPIGEFSGMGELATRSSEKIRIMLYRAYGFDINVDPREGVYVVVGVYQNKSDYRRPEDLANAIKKAQVVEKELDVLRKHVKMLDANRSRNMYVQENQAGRSR